MAWGLGETVVGDGGVGLVLSWIRWVWVDGVVGGPGQKTSNRSPCPVPLVVKLNVKCQGSVETDAYEAEFGSEWTNGFEGIRLVQIYKSTLLSSSWQPVVSLKLKGKQWLTQNEAVNIEIMHIIGLDREVYAQEETKEKHVKKKANAWLLILKKDESSDHSPLNVKGDRLSS